MKTSVALRAAMLLVAGLLPSFASAQFQQPTPEELKMTADPSAPGAAAVYLDIEQTADDNLHYRSYYARIKVLTEKGKELATVNVPYVEGSEKVTAIQGRTIHPDGTVVPLEGKPEDLLLAKSGDARFGRKVFTLPSVEVGSILEYRYQIQWSDDICSSPVWQIQQPYFVHKAHYSFIPFEAFLKGHEGSLHYLIDPETQQALDNLQWWSRLPPGAHPPVQDALGRYTLDVSDVPAEPNEEFMPPIGALLYQVGFYYTATVTGPQFWDSVAKRWSKNVDHFAEVSDTIRAAVAGIVAPGDSPLDKARKLYVAVQALDNTDYSREKTQSEMKELKIKVAKRAEDTWKQKSGDSEDIALLYLAMLRAAGLQAWAAKVRDRGDGPFDVTYLSSRQFDDTLVILEAGDHGILLDPGEKMCPFQKVSWRHSEVGGMRQTAQGAGFVVTPAQSYKDNVVTRVGDITLDEHGGVSGSINFIMVGQEALRWRQMALQNDIGEVKKSFDSELQHMVPVGVEAHVNHFLAMDQPEENLIAIVDVKGTMGTAMGKRLLLPGFFFESRGETPFVKEVKRIEPVEMRYAGRVIEQMTYHLPAGMTVEGMPQEASQIWAGHAVYRTKVASSPGQVIVARALTWAFSQAKPDEYQDLRSFYQKVAAGDGQEMVLRGSGEAKGN